jgi:acyl-CoA dehydrogenase
MRATENVTIQLSGVVAADQIVGGLGGFRRVAIEAFAPIAHLGWSAIWLGAARAAFSDLLREIRAGGRIRVDTRSPLTAARIAAIRTRLEVVSSYLHTTLAEVTDRLERGLSLEPAAVQVHLNTLKIVAAQETYAAADDMVALSGIRMGYLKGSPIALERLLRDLRAASLTYDDSRLQVANGNLSLLDPAVSLAGDDGYRAGKEPDRVE